MARLVVQFGTSAAWDIPLKAGTNSIGRGPDNDFMIEDDSVSTTHCQIVVDSGSAVIRDLGSTNGTYVNCARVSEAALQPGQTIHLGSLELLFDSDAPEQAGAAAPVAAARAVPEGAPPVLPPVTSPPRPARAGPAARFAVGVPPPPLGARQTVPIAAPLAAAAPSAATGSGPCKYHPKTPGRFVCSHCQIYFCELCVTTRGQQKFCRACGAECAPARVQIQRPKEPKGGFYARLPGAFVFPFRGSGVLLLVAGTILLAVLRLGGAAVTLGMAGMVGGVVSAGYLLTYMQSIIHSTAVGEEEMPPLPGLTNFWEDILLPYFQLMGLMLISFAPAIGVRWWVIATQQESMGLLVQAVFALGYLYFPMGLLALAMLDSVAAANPLLVIPSILKVPLEYLVTLIALAGVLGISELGDSMLRVLFPRGVGTHSVAKLLELFAAQAFWSLASLYLLIVSMRILGLLYLTNKDKLGWYNR